MSEWQELRDWFAAGGAPVYPVAIVRLMDSIDERFAFLEHPENSIHPDSFEEGRLAGVKEERERIARLAEEWPRKNAGYALPEFMEFARLIRAQGTPGVEGEG